MYKLQNKKVMKRGKDGKAKVVKRCPFTIKLAHGCFTVSTFIYHHHFYYTVNYYSFKAKEGFFLLAKKDGITLPNIINNTLIKIRLTE